MGRNGASRRAYSQIAAGITALAALGFGAATAQAAGVLNSCITYCHDTSPRDGARKGNLHFGSRSSAFLGSHQKHLPAAPVAGDCSVCHKPVAPTAFGHQNGVIEMANSLKGYSSAVARARYDKGVFFNQTSIPNLTLATCSSVSCHFEKKTPVWGSTALAAPADCAACHGAPPAGTAAAAGSAGSHARHDVYFTGSANCQKCHPNHLAEAAPFAHATSAGRALKVTPTDPAGTASGSYSGSGTNYQPSQAAVQVFGACTNTYCHSTGNPAVAVASLPAAYGGSGFATVTWGSGTQTCNACHGRSTSDGMPDYANAGTPGSATANSHPKHVTGSAIGCNECHERTTKNNISIRPGFPGTHVNKTADVFFNLSGSNKSATYTAGVGAKTCSNTFCHGGAGSSVTWGGASFNCQDCHGGGAAASVADFGGTFWSNGAISKFQMTGTGSWADTGHGRPTASGAYPGSANPAANFAGVANFCEWCHDSTIGHNVSANPFRLRSWTDATWGKNGVCMACHATASTGVTVAGVLRNSASNKIGAYHYGAKHTTALSGGQYCWDCHDPHGSGLNSAGGANQFMIRTQVAIASDATTGAPTAQSATAVVFTLSATPTGTDYARSAAPFNGICNVCHTTTGHYTTSSGDAHNSGTRCTSCHSHSGDGSTKTSGFTPAGGGVSTGGNPCFGCHSNFQAAMSVTGTARTGSYHHVLGTSATDAGDLAPNAGSYSTSTSNLYCTSCHADHNYFNNGGTVVTKGANLRSDIAVASGAAPVNTDFLATGSFGICVSCHNSSLTRDTANQAAGGVASTPVIAGAQFAASMHNYTTMSAFGTQLFAANCVKCHTDEQAKDKQTSVNKFGPHFSASVSILDDLGAGTVAQYREQYICFRCHSKTSDTSLGGTLKATAGKDWFGSNTMRSFAEDTFQSFSAAGRSPRHRISQYTGLHKANETLADIALAKHVECADCHSPHAAKFGNHSSSAPGTARGLRPNTVSGVLTGVPGVRTIAAAAWVQLSYSSNLQPAKRDYQVCFKCHSNAMGAAGWFKNQTSAGQMGGKSLTWTNLGLEFNPANKSFHPVLAPLNGTGSGSTVLTASYLNNGWKPGDLMTCTDCHATDSTASKGPHGSSVKWMLAGVNKAWPYTSAASNGASTGTYYAMSNKTTGQGTVNGLFCLNCHVVTSTNAFHAAVNSFTSHHSFTMNCVSCHIRVPHGGKISRLLNTVTNVPSRYMGDGNGTNVSGTRIISKFTKGAATPANNFTCSGGTHSGGTESW